MRWRVFLVWGQVDCFVGGIGGSLPASWRTGQHTVRADGTAPISKQQPKLERMKSRRYASSKLETRALLKACQERALEASMLWFVGSATTMAGPPNKIQRSEDRGDMGETMQVEGTPGASGAQPAQGREGKAQRRPRNNMHIQPKCRESHHWQEQSQGNARRRGAGQAQGQREGAEKTKE